MRWSPILPAVLLSAALASAPAHGQAADSLPYVTSIRTLPDPPCDSIPTRIVIEGVFPTSCGRVVGDRDYTVFVTDPAPPCAGCLGGPTPWADTLEVGLLAAGQHLFRLSLGVIDICSVPEDTTYYDTRFGITVGTTCPPSRPFNPMTYVDRVLITPARDPSTPIICEGDSVLIRMSGTFPSDCHVLRKIELLPSVETVVPTPIRVRLMFDNLCCAGRACVAFPTPWHGEIVIPLRPPGLQDLRLEAVEVCCRDFPIPGDPTGERHFAFSVIHAESCGVLPPPLACLYPGWLHDQPGECDAFVSKTGDPAAITMTMHTTVALAGFQGEVHSFQQGGGNTSLMVHSIEPIGPAAGMHLTWEQTPGGARFVLFADQGAPIPPDSGRRPSQVLRIRWFPGIRDTRDSNIIDSSTRWSVSWSDIFGSDIDGKLVPLCPIRTASAVADLATICMGDPRLCDLNGDAQADVRDLVLMAHCMISPRACPWDGTSLDCDADNDFDFDDLSCCARHVLGVPPCDGCQDSVRKESGIALTFGSPQRTADGIDIPVRIDGAGRIGAARLQFTLPGALAAGAAFEMNASGWLPVIRNSAGGMEVGLIQLPSITTEVRLDRLDATFHLPIPVGSEVSGQVRLSANQISGQDGVMLDADLGNPAVRLGPGLGVSLSQARPNPFGTSTTFRLTLDAPADADVGIYDLSGRRLATLHKGPLAIGSHPFTWDGRTEGGSRAHAGVFFVRATVAGKTSMQKLVMLRD